MKKFDLINEGIEFDFKTLNYVWERLYRLNLASQNKNADDRSRHSERKRIMKMLEELSLKVRL